MVKKVRRSGDIRLKSGTKTSGVNIDKVTRVPKQKKEPPRKEGPENEIIDITKL